MTCDEATILKYRPQVEAEFPIRLMLPSEFIQCFVDTVDQRGPKGKSDVSALPPMCSDCGYEFVAGTSTEETCPRCGGRRTTLRIDVSDQAAVAGSDVGMVTVWMSSSFARLWYEDALQEARTGAGFNARRKEIVFAVCFVESYLLEWVRDEALKRDFKRIRDYFRIRRGILDRWKDVMKQLAKDALIPATPAFGLPYWEDFKTLVSYRDGLVHAGASRPESDGVPDEERPVPPRQSLDTMPAGWPVGEVVRRLHAAAGTTPLDWLVEP